MSEQFTKGPWCYDAAQGIVLDASGDVVCDIMPTGVADYDANAALIACAPEMYEMLKALKAQITDTNADADVSHIDALLAKARGES